MSVFREDSSEIKIDIVNNSPYDLQFSYQFIIKNLQVQTRLQQNKTPLSAIKTSVYKGINFIKIFLCTYTYPRLIHFTHMIDQLFEEKNIQK